MVGCTVHDLIIHELDADFTEDEVDTILRDLPSGKTLVGMASQMKFLNDIKTF